jgi:hypothetical protein
MAVVRWIGACLVPYTADPVTLVNNRVRETLRHHRFLNQGDVGFLRNPRGMFIRRFVGKQC